MPITKKCFKRADTIECPVKASNCPTNVTLNNISSLILLTDDFGAHQVDLREKIFSSVLSLVGVILRQMNGIRFGRQAHTYKQSESDSPAAASRLLAERV